MIFPNHKESKKHAISKYHLDDSPIFDFDLDTDPS